MGGCGELDLVSGGGGGQMISRVRLGYGGKRRGCRALLSFSVISLGEVSQRRWIKKLWTAQISYSGVIRGQSGSAF